MSAGKERVVDLVWILLLSVMPTATLYALLRVFRWLATADGWPWRRARPTPAARSIETLSQDLARLQREFVRIHRDNPIAKARKLEAVTLAYDDTLGAACAALDLSAPDRRPMGDFERLETEAVLAQHGLRW